MKLRAMNPRHQVVVLAGDAITAAWEQWRLRPTTTGATNARTL